MNYYNGLRTNLYCGVQKIIKFFKILLWGWYSYENKNDKHRSNNTTKG